MLKLEEHLKKWTWKFKIWLIKLKDMNLLTVKHTSVKKKSKEEENMNPNSNQNILENEDFSELKLNQSKLSLEVMEIDIL